MNEVAKRTSPISVLVIDDLKDTADTLAEYLRQGCGYEVRVANDGVTGLKWAQKQPPDVVISDIGLPQLDGLQVARQIRETVFPCPLLIAVTAYGGTFTRESAYEAFDYYHVKPADPRDIAALVGPIRRCDSGG
jgi:DNA-binding response OmpR family regulator